MKSASIVEVPYFDTNDVKPVSKNPGYYSMVIVDDGQVLCYDSALDKWYAFAPAWHIEVAPPKLWAYVSVLADL